MTCLPSYGAEVRGGTANCTVVIADEEIASPVASEPEFAVLMNNPSLFRFQNQVQIRRNPLPEFKHDRVKAHPRRPRDL